MRFTPPRAYLTRNSATLWSAAATYSTWFSLTSTTPLSLILTQESYTYHPPVVIGNTFPLVSHTQVCEFSYRKYTSGDYALLYNILSNYDWSCVYGASSVDSAVAIPRTQSVKDLGVYLDSRLHFHDHVNFIFSPCIKVLLLIRSIAYNYSTLECMLVLCFVLVRSKVEYASVVWNSITSADANKLERIQKKFTALCFKRFFPQVNCCTPYKRHHLDAFFLTQVYRGILIALLLWKLLAFGFLLDIFENVPCSVSLLLVKIAPHLDARQQLMLFVGMLTS
jgi:hypothetical protein